MLSVLINFDITFQNSVSCFVQSTYLMVQKDKSNLEFLNRLAYKKNLGKN
jgi:hypothetical protein